jgi:hypothetical protein
VGQYVESEEQFTKLTLHEGSGAFDAQNSSGQSTDCNKSKIQNAEVSLTKADSDRESSSYHYVDSSEKLT